MRSPCGATAIQRYRFFLRRQPMVPRRLFAPGTSRIVSVTFDGGELGRRGRNWCVVARRYNNGKTHKYYYSPNGRRYRSKRRAHAAIVNNEPGL